MKKLYTLLLVSTTLLFACSDDDDFNYALNINWADSEFVEFGSSVEFNVDKNCTDALVISAPKGWTVIENGSKLKITAPDEGEADTETSGEIRVSLGACTNTVWKSTIAHSGIIVGFEDTPQQYLAIDEDGTNLYSSYGTEQYIDYTDPSSGLHISLNSNYGPYDFWSGGTALSTWNIMTLDGYDYFGGNQCSVYYKDNATGNGGHNGSKVFAIATGDDNYLSAPVIEFENDSEYTIDHLWFTNTTYTAIILEEGSDFSATATYETNDIFTVTAKGYDKTGKETGSATFYLADFRTANAPGILKEWEKADLSPLGKVNSVKFVFEASENLCNTAGIAVPTYFCFDDMAIRK